MPDGGVALDGVPPVGMGGGIAAGPDADADAPYVPVHFVAPHPVNLHPWLRDRVFDALESAWGGIQTVGTRGNDFVHDHPVAASVSVAAVAVTTVYDYGPTLLDYALKDTQCYVDGSEDYRAVLRLDNLKAPTSRYEEWGISYQGFQACYTGTRPHLARLEEARLETLRQEREEQERKEQEEARKQQEEQERKEREEASERTKASQLATEKHADQREQAQQHDEASTYKYDDLPAGAAEIRQILDLVVLWVPVAVYFFFGDKRRVTYIFAGLSFLLGVSSFFVEHGSYYEELDRRARAGDMVEQQDRNGFVVLLFIVGIIKDLAILLGILACFRIIDFVIRTYPASPVVWFISALVTQIREQQLSVESLILCILWAYDGFSLWMPYLWLLLQSWDLYKSTRQKRAKEEEENWSEDSKSGGKKKKKKHGKESHARSDTEMK